MTQNVTRSQVLAALAELNIDPKSTEEIHILTDKLIVRTRQIILIEDPAVPADEHTHTERG